MIHQVKNILFDVVFWDGDKVSEVPEWISKGLDSNRILRYGNEVHIINSSEVKIAKPGSYIIHDGEDNIYPLSKKDFMNIFDSVDYFGFPVSIELLKLGFALEREKWNGKYSIYKQIPAIIEKDNISNLKSMPDSVKNYLSKNKSANDLYYENQCVILDKERCSIDSWSPSIEDVFAKDWMITADSE